MLSHSGRQKWLSEKYPQGHNKVLYLCVLRDCTTTTEADWLKNPVSSLWHFLNKTKAYSWISSLLTISGISIKKILGFEFPAAVELICNVLSAKRLWGTAIWLYDCFSLKWWPQTSNQNPGNHPWFLITRRHYITVHKKALGGYLFPRDWTHFHGF